MRCGGHRDPSVRVLELFLQRLQLRVDFDVAKGAVHLVSVGLVTDEHFETCKQLIGINETLWRSFESTELALQGADRSFELGAFRCEPADLRFGRIMPPDRLFEQLRVVGLCSQGPAAGPGLELVSCLFQLSVRLTQGENVPENVFPRFLRAHTRQIGMLHGLYRTATPTVRQTLRPNRLSSDDRVTRETAARQLDSACDTFGVSDRAVEPLLRYFDDLSRFNRRFGLVKDDADRLVSHHLIDSLAALPVIDRVLGQTAGVSRIIDIGSGAGLPGVPLALARPQWSVCLVERSARRAAFLRGTIAVLGIGSLDVAECSIEEFPGTADLFVARAFAPLARIVASLPSGSDQAPVVAYKGRHDTVIAELEQLPGNCATEVIALDHLWLDGDRTLVVVQRKRVDTGAP